MKSTKILLFVMLSGIISLFSSCDKGGDDDNPVGVVGTWRINSITNAGGQTPTSLQTIVNGTATFGTTTYDIKNASGTGVENGGYVYTANANTLAVTPVGTSPFTSSNAAYTFSTELSGDNLQLRVNTAAPGKPEQTITISLTRQ